MFQTPDSRGKGTRETSCHQVLLIDAIGFVTATAAASATFGVDRAAAAADGSADGSCGQG